MPQKPPRKDRTNLVDEPWPATFGRLWIRVVQAVQFKHNPNLRQRKETDAPSPLNGGMGMGMGYLLCNVIKCGT